jgi:hypothetical protein
MHWESGISSWPIWEARTSSYAQSWHRENLPRSFGRWYEKYSRLTTIGIDAPSRSPVCPVTVPPSPVVFLVIGVPRQYDDLIEKNAFGNLSYSLSLAGEARTCRV